MNKPITNPDELNCSQADSTRDLIGFITIDSSKEEIFEMMNSYYDLYVIQHSITKTLESSVESLEETVRLYKERCDILNQTIEELSKENKKPWYKRIFSKF